MNVQMISVKKINPALYNPRVDLKPGDPAYEQLARSMDEFGCVEPLVWNKRTGHLVGGHQRFKVLLAGGRKRVAVSVVDLPPAKEKALNIALNRIAGDWDERKLAELLDELTRTPQIDVELTGFDLPDVEELVANLLADDPEGEEDDFDLDAALDTSRPAGTKADELLELGRHRLLCGDSTDAGDVRRVMAGRKAALFATDPPYLVNYDGMNHPGKAKQKRAARGKNKDWSGSYGITWDDAEANPRLYERFIGVAVSEAVAPDAAWYCWHASRRQAMVEGVWEKFGAFVHQQIIWAKDRPILGRSWHGWQHEPFFFGWVRPHKPPRCAADHASTIWQLPTVAVGQKTDHPTSKPVELFAIPMRQHTRRGEVCYEPFCGSGSQLIAAEKLGRRCYAIEISPHYCDVIVRRWIAFVGETRCPPDLVERYRLPDDSRTRKEVA